MSRCFPYPPPGYIQSDAAIELKKRQPMEKNKRMEKREKRKEKRRRLSKSEHSSGLSDEHGRPENFGEEICSIFGGRCMTMSDAVLNNPKQEVELRYKCLLANWFPPPIEDANVYPVDSDWLQSEGASCSRNSAMGTTPVYALPYVVPY